MVRACNILVLLLAVGCGDIARSQSDPEPDPALSPAEVVRIQLEAMARNNDPLPNAGVAIAFRFASPSNRAVTGPLDRFTAMVNSEPYRAMIDNDGIDVGEPMLGETHALVPVRIRSRQGHEVGYLFVLSRQEQAPYTGCWMTDSVMPVSPEDEVETPVI